MNVLDGEPEHSQELLVELLQIDLGLGSTFLQTAALAGSKGHRDMAIQKARDALHTIRHLSAKIIDATQAAEIKVRADELEAAIPSA